MMAGKHPSLRFMAAVLLCGGLYFGFVSAQEPGEPKTKAASKLFVLPKALFKPAPETVQDLRDIEKHVQKVVEKVLPAVVGVRVGPGQGSGVIIKEDGTILTAGHVSGAPNQNAAVLLVNDLKNFKKGKTLGRFKSIDSGMMKITDEGKYPHLEMGNSADLKVGQWVIAIGHPGGVRANRGPVVRVGRILFVNQFVIRTDCTLVGGDSGGPLFDMQGRVIGIHSRIGGLAISENMHVPIDTYRETWDKLAAGDQWGRDIGQMPTVLSLGGKVVFEAKDKLVKDDPTQQCPKDPNDKNLKSYRKTYKVPMKAGHAYTVDLVSSDKSGKKLDTFLRIEGPDGKEIAHDDDGGGFPHSRIVHRPTKDGEFGIVATSFEARQVGDFVLTVRDADFRAGPVDVLKALKLPLPAVEAALKEFTKAKKQLHVHGLIVDDKGAPFANKEITIKWNQGKETIKTNREGFIHWPLNKDKAKKLSAELPSGVRAALVLTDQDGEYIPFGEGKNDKSLETVKSAGGPVVKSIDGAIVKTDPFDVEREKCYRHIHEFKMQAGKTYTIDLTSEEFDSYLRVEHEEKGKLAEDDDGGGFLNSRIVFTPEKTDTYRLIVTTCDPGQSGTYQLTIREVTAKSAQPKKVGK